MKKFFFVLLIFFLIGSNVLAQEEIELNLFYSYTCPHCHKEIEFLEQIIEEKYPQIDFYKYEIIQNAENQELLGEFYEDYNVPLQERGLVPILFSPTAYFLGFNDQIKVDIENCLNQCIDGNNKSSIPNSIILPFIGEIDVSQMSLVVLTIVMGAIDGLNPCAMWVLLFLITLLINTRSRKRMWLIGGTFILASGVVYFLILSAWLNLFLVISYVNITRILIGLLALGVGLWQIKNFITYHPGVCKVLGVESKTESRLKEKAESIVASPLTFITIISLIALAVGVNLIEFFCSAGLPAIYTRILALSSSGLNYYLYLLLYTIVFMLDDLIIFSIAMITLRRVGFTEKYNYWATLIGGLLILVLGLLLIFKPTVLMFV